MQKATETNKFPTKELPPVNSLRMIEKLESCQELLFLNKNVEHSQDYFYILSIMKKIQGYLSVGLRYNMYNRKKTGTNIKINHSTLLSTGKCMLTKNQKNSNLHQGRQYFGSPKNYG